MYESLLDTRRLNIIKRCCGKNVASELLSSLRQCLASGGFEKNKIIELFHIMDNSQNIDASNYDFYSIGNRKIILVKNNSDAESAINNIYKHQIIGFDTEQKPNFKKGEKSNEIAIIQIATNSACYIFQMKYITQSGVVLKLIESEEVVKVGFGLENDISELKCQFSITPKSIIDFQGILKKLSSKNEIGAKGAVKIFLKKRIKKSKSVALSNWELNSLKSNQLTYASEDASAPLDTFNKCLSDYPETAYIMPSWFRKRLDHGVE